MDPYQVLGVDPDADESAIKKAYRMKAAVLHPDKPTGNDTSFKNLTVAFNLAMEAIGKRQDCADTDRVIPGEDMSVEISVTLEEAISGCVKEVVVPSHVVVCLACNGSGKDPSVTAAPCFTCMGRKFVFDAKNVMVPCRTCGGSGSVMTVSCDRCRGTGRVKRDVVISVRIPPGVSSDNEIRFPGQGLPGVNAPNGDLYVKVRQKRHGNFLRKGDDLTVAHVVSFSDLLTGTTVTIEVPGHGDVAVPIPPMTQPGSEVKVDGKGVRNIHTGTFGNLVVKVKTKFPKRLSPRAKRLIEELAMELRRSERR